MASDICKTGQQPMHNKYTQTHSKQKKKSEKQSTMVETETDYWTLKRFKPRTVAKSQRCFIFSQLSQPHLKCIQIQLLKLRRVASAANHLNPRLCCKWRNATNRSESPTSISSSTKAKSCWTWQQPSLTRSSGKSALNEQIFSREVTDSW